MARFTSFVMVALVAIVCSLGFVSNVSAQISVRVESVANGNVVAGSTADLCYIRIRSEETVNLRYLRISQVFDQRFNRTVRSIGIHGFEGGYDQRLDENGNADFSFFTGHDDVIIAPGQEFSFTCTVRLNPISPQESFSGDQLVFVVRSTQGFLAETENGERITSFGPFDLNCGRMMVRATFPIVPDLGVVASLTGENLGGGGPSDLLDFSISAAEGGNLTLVRVPIRLSLFDSVYREGAVLTLSNFQVLEGSSENNLEYLAQDDYSVFTEQGELISGRDGRLFRDQHVGAFKLLVQFNNERRIQAGSTKYFRIRATAENVNTGPDSQDAISTYLTAELSAGTGCHFLDMSPGDSPMASLYDVYNNDDRRWYHGSIDWIWSDMSGTDGNHQHDQNSDPSSRDYIAGLRIGFGGGQVTYLSVFGNEYYDRDVQVGHQAGDVIGLWCDLSSDQQIAGVQFRLTARHNNNRVALEIDSVSVSEELAGQVQVQERDGLIIVLSADGSAINLQGNRRLVTAWATIPEDIRPQDLNGIYQVEASDILLSSPNGDEVGFEEVHQGWFWVGPLGDMNHDGFLDVRDLIRLVNVILDGSTIWEYQVGDLNRDSQVDADDVATLIDAILDGAGRDSSPSIEAGQVWEGNLDDVWQYELSNENPVKVFQLSLRGDLENIEPYLTERSVGMSLAYRYDPETRTMKVVVYSLGQTIESGEGPVLIIPGHVEEVIFEKVVQVNPQGVPARPLEGRPAEFKLNSAYPNPFNATTHVAFDLPQASRVTMSLYDVSGREAIRLIDGSVPAGTHSVAVNAQGLATGTYVLRLETSSGVRSQKLMLVK